jgi:hypothetical protein
MAKNISGATKSFVKTANFRNTCRNRKLKGLMSKGVCPFLASRIHTTVKLVLFMTELKITTAHDLQKQALCTEDIPSSDVSEFQRGMRQADSSL